MGIIRKSLVYYTISPSFKLLSCFRRGLSNVKVGGTYLKKKATKINLRTVDISIK